MPAARRPPSRPQRGLRGNRNFLLFWAGESVSLIGTYITELALPLTAVLVLSVDSLGLGTLRFAQFIPFLLFSLLFGVLVDSVRKRPLMLLANCGRAFLIALVAALYALHQLHLPVLYIVAFLVGTLTVLFDLCWMSYVPLLVDRSHLTEANSKVATSVATAEIAGPGVAGALVQIATAPIALLVDAVSYVVSMVSLFAIRVTEPAPIRPVAQRRRLRSEIADGLRWVARSPYIRTPTAIAGGYNFFYLFTEALLPLYALRTLGLTVAQYGLILSIGSVGGLAGAAVANRLVRHLHLGRTYTMAVLAGYSAPLLIPLAHGGHTFVLLLLIVAIFVRQLAAGIANVVGITLRQSATPQQLMGRMTAAVRMLLYGLGAVGAPVGGVVGAFLGLRAGLWIAAAGSCIVALALLFSSIPRLRTLPGPDEEPAVSA